jgi:predicted alpha-1,6-mannanase (GH76 family)
MLNSGNLINDGLTSECQNNHETEFTYNQGVILSGAANLYRVFNDSSYLHYAENIAFATLTHLVWPDGVLSEVCDNEPGMIFLPGNF